MYDKRIKIFVIFTVLLFTICILRLAQMQLLRHSAIQDKISELRLQYGRLRRLKTVRGKILDRNGKVLAVDKPIFELCIDYETIRCADDRAVKARLAAGARKKDADKRVPKIEQNILYDREKLEEIIEKLVHFGLERNIVEEKIDAINGRIWRLREHLAWKRKDPDADDFETAVPDETRRLLLINKVDIAEMHRSFPLLELKTDDDVFTAQVEFLNVDGIKISALPMRYYPYVAVASQTIGWVGPALDQQNEPDQDELTRYLKDELCGKEDGVEYVCEKLLRGKRGREQYDIDSKMVDKVETKFGEDIALTIDIELQAKIERHMSNPDYNPGYYNSGMAAVVIDIASGDILAMVSLPVYDLNKARDDYGRLLVAKNEPLRNRAINKRYPPGSIAKPFIFIAAMQSKKTYPEEVISCPAEEAPGRWPSCWIFRKHGIGHDSQHENNARNAIKGSCNIYFSRLADRIDSKALQKLLFSIGYGRRALAIPDYLLQKGVDRNFRQIAGVISSKVPDKRIEKFEDISRLNNGEKRFFGIGQGNFRVNPLQAANAMAAIARGGLFRRANLFAGAGNDSVSLDISPRAISVVREGMNAVVSEYGGTAFRSAFENCGFDQSGVTVYGKTGSTQGSANAWFAGFAEDSKDRSIAVAVVVESGQHGSSDAAPLARDMIQFCIESGYIGQGDLETDQ